jgi:phytoene synthase
LTQYGIRSAAPKDAIRHPEIKGVCRALAARAEKCFAQADRLLAKAERDMIRPALIMQHSYRRILERLKKRDWERLDQRVKLGRVERLWIGVRHGWF